MTSIISISKKISVESKYLDMNINENILTKLKEFFKNECTKDDGYYLDIIKVKKIIDNYISSNCENIFEIEFEAEILKPEAGKIFEGEVCMIFSGGIFVNIKNKLKVLIPISTLNNYEFDQTKNMFINKNNKNEIKQSTILSVLISGTKYTKRNFSCFGTLVEK
jgi:DNA-directed RNA polymerase subunit E'/Rpb7